MPQKTVLITGCSSGIGLALTKALLHDGWRVIATTRNLAASTQLNELSHPSLTLMKCDVTNADERMIVKNYIQTHLNQQLDCLINNAGYGLLGPLEVLSEAQMREQFDINFFGLIAMTQCCLPALRQSKGRIINFSSVLGYLGFPLQSLYVASKFAVEGLSESLHYELASHGVQVTLIEPGAYNTSFGKNVILLDESNADSPYKNQSINLAKFRQTLQHRSSGSPKQLADSVVAMLKKAKMPLRKRMGNDAHMIYFAKRLLPNFLYEWLIKKVCQRIFDASNHKNVN
jgi:NAD(P)-dependent dehydrogenase (short-subunit alcohol dehydrogenase family)